MEPITTTTTWDGQDTGKAYQYWKAQAAVRQRIINKQNKTIENLTASVLCLENDVARLEHDYDLVESELKALKEKKPRRMMIL